MEEPIAIIGIGCRFPGGAGSPAAFWRMLLDGTDTIREIPHERFDLARIFDADPAAPGKMYTRWGAFVDGIDQFDPGFFGFSRREALRIDPQHRLLLEVTWEALEDAGVPSDRLAGSRTGVFVGMSTHDYPDIQAYPANRALIDAHTNSGGASSIAANRVSYIYDLRGPSFVVDTACSSSLVAVHLACQSLRSGDCELALVGGVQAVLAPELTIGFCKASMISPDGRCKAFSAEANGYVRGEGAGLVVLKTLARALADGDSIHAVVRGSAINEDGRTTGMTVPSRSAQQEVLREACRRAGVQPGDLEYVEAHGTGTAVGDPIEAAALAVLGCERPPGDVLRIGSVKTNIGHLEAASGIAGLIKAALVVEHRQIPPSLHFRTPNPAIPFDEYRLRVVDACEPWPDGRPALAGVNSFGFGGANAHVVLEGPPSETRHSIATAAEGAPARAGMLVVSARSEESLRRLAQAYRGIALAGRPPGLADLCAAAALQRSHHDHRLGIVGMDLEDLADNLDAFLNQESRADVVSGRAPHGKAARVAFVFAGMGPQWWGMGRQLLEREPVFRAVIDECDRLIHRHAEWSLVDELTADESRSRVAAADLAQPVNFAFQAGLLALWRSWGIEPAAVVGHSAGEIAAAYAAGVLDLDEAVRVAFYRGLLQHRASGLGRMLAVGEGLEPLQPLLDGYDGRIAVAALNSPVSITLSGDSDAIAELAARIEKQGAFCRVMSVDVPYHSHHMDPIRDDLLEALAGLRVRAAAVPIVSEVTGDWAREPFDASYWWRNIRLPVRFGDAILRLAADGYDTFLELSPHPVLVSSVLECLKQAGTPGVCLPSLRRHEDDRRMMLRTLAGLYARGAEVQWEAALGRPKARVALPLYPWHKERVWIETTTADAAADSQPAGSDTRILGRRGRAVQPHWDVDLASPVLAYIQDHRIHGAIVFPGAAYTAMGLEAAAEIAPGASPALEEVEFKRALFIPDTGAVHLQTTYDGSTRRVGIHALNRTPADEWTLHAACRVAAAPASPPAVDLDAIRRRCAQTMGREEFYEEVMRRGFTFGPRFRGLERIAVGAGEALGRVRLPDDHAVEVDTGARVHPALFDSALQVLIAAVASSDHGAAGPAAFLPTDAARVVSYRPAGSAFWSHGTVSRTGPDGFEGSVTILDDAGEVLLQVEGLRAKVLEDVRGAAAASADDCVYHLQWQEQPLAAAAWREGAPWCSPARTAETVARDADRLSEKSGFARYYADVEPALERIARAFFVRALTELGLDWRRGAAVRGDRLPDGTVLSGPRRRQLEALIGALAAERLLTPAAGGATVARTPEHEDPLQLVEQLRATQPSYASVLDVMARCGPALADVLCGRRDAPEVLFDGDGGARMRAFYRDAPACRLFNALTAEAIGAALATFPPDRELRVLEIGAGTGSTTRDVLPRLPEGRCRYAFTDISPRFLELARIEVGTPAFVRYTPLDIERDPLAQGFEAHAFDLVVAANVVHATRDVARTLGHIRTLLAPGGMVVLQEITRGPRWLDLVFGITDGWWAFEDAPLRTRRAVLDVAAWERTLAAAGFEEPAHVTEHGDPVPGQAVLLARAPAVPHPTQAARETWLVFADRSGLGEVAAETLRRRGCTCAVAFVGDAFRRREDDTYEVPLASPSGMAQLLEGVEREIGAPAGIVHLWSLDIPPSPDGGAPALMAAQARGCGSMVDFLHAWRGAGGRGLRRAVLVTGGAQPVDDTTEAGVIARAPLWGFGRVLVHEHPELHPVLIDCSTAPDPDEAAAIVREALASDREDEVAIRGSRRFVRRLVRLDLQLRRPSASAATRPAGGRPFRAEVTTSGSLDSVRLRARPLPRLGPEDVEIEVKAASLNFRDVMFAMGMLPPAAFDSLLGAGALGVDCAGVVRAVGARVRDVVPGDEVVALSSAALASHAITPDVVVRKPAGLSFEEAAGLPIAYVTALYALEDVARLAKGERVLIHAATGGVGLAALAVAGRAGAEIFATAGSEAKRQYLRERGIRHVMDSRTLDFAVQVMAATGGRGVDVVLNSLPGEAMRKGLSVLAPGGRFLEIGKADIYRNTELPLEAFRRNVSFAAIQIDGLFETNRGVLRDLMARVARAIEERTLPALPVHVFSIAAAAEGLRTIAQARHIGKVVVALDRPDVPIEASADAPLFRGDATYLVTGGRGGVGTALAKWAVRHGARRLALMSRRATASDDLAALSDRGVDVLLLEGDVTRPADVERALETADRPDAPLKGVFHAAMVIDDAPIAELDAARFARVMAPKIEGAWNLHTATRDRALDYFVMFSSITSVYGNRWQANYAAANAFLDAFAGYRRAQGLPALTVNWGVFEDAGYVSQRKELGGFLARQGQYGLPADAAFAAMAELMTRPIAQAAVSRTDWRLWAGANPAAGTSPRFRALVEARAAAEPGALHGPGRVLDDFLARPEAERRPEIATHLRRRVARILGTSPERIEPAAQLTDMGMDSLMAVELLTELKNDFAIDMPAVKLLQGVTLDQLADRVVDRLRTPGEAVAAQQTSPAPAVRAMQLPILAEPEPPPPGIMPAAAAAPYRRWTPFQRVARAAVTAFTRAVADVHVEGLEHIPSNGPVLLAANHVCTWDAPVLLCVARRPAVIFAAEELRERFLMHWSLHKIWGAIYLRRGEGDTEALARALEVLAGGGMLGVAPEGHRSRAGLQRGLTGVSHLALQSGAPTVPIAVYGQERISAAWRRASRAPVSVRIGAPVPAPAGPPTAETLRAHTDRVMLEIARLLPVEYRGVYAPAVERNEAEARCEIA